MRTEKILDLPEMYITEGHKERIGEAHELYELLFNHMTPITLCTIVRPEELVERLKGKVQWKLTEWNVIKQLCRLEELGYIYVSQPNPTASLFIYVMPPQNMKDGETAGLLKEMADEMNTVIYKDEE